MKTVLQKLLNHMKILGVSYFQVLLKELIGICLRTKF